MIINFLVEYLRRRIWIGGSFFGPRAIVLPLVMRQPSSLKLLITYG